MLAPTLKTASAAASTTADVSGKAAHAVETSVGWFLAWPSEWPGFHQMLRSCEHMSSGTAIVLMLAGAGFLAYGHSAHKLIMSLNCAVLGAWAGGMLGKQGDAVVPGLLVGGFLGGLAAWPLLKFSIQLIAAAVGFVVGCCIWRTFPNLSPNYAWAGGAIGSTFLFMLTHSSVRWAIVLATGFEGAAMLVMGVVGGLFQITSIRGNVEPIIANVYTIPVAVGLITFFGLMYQHRYAGGGGNDDGQGNPPPARR
jgi:hypothetical protein